MRKLLSTAVAVGIVVSSTLTPAAYADVAANALPQLNSATNAKVTTPHDNNMNVEIQGGQGGVGTLNWKEFNVGRNSTVNFEFTAHNQTALNKVEKSGGMSQIYGKITDSGCYNCGYEGTGKIILINPNGVLFGDGANVNVNSFTVSTMDGTYDQNKRQLQLNKDQNQSSFGIKVLGGAKIHGDKNVTFASNNIDTYTGSKISTSIDKNVNNKDSYGKVKLVTADGVNFQYYNNGAVEKVSDLKTSADKMMVSLNGEITSGNIDIRNYSTNAGSEINLKGATLKATKAVSGNDGNIWLTAQNNVVVEDTTFTTANAQDADKVAGGNVVILAGKKASIGSSNITAVGDVKITSNGNSVVVDKTTITTPKDVILKAADKASIQNSSNVKGNNVTVEGTTRAQVNASTVAATGGDVNITSGNDIAWTDKANITAAKDINVTSKNNSLLMSGSTLNAKNDINLTSKGTISSSKLSSSTFTASKDVNLNSTGEDVILTDTAQFKPTGLLNIVAARNAQLAKDGDLTAQKVTFSAGENVILASNKGAVTVDSTTKFLKAKKVYIQGGTDVKTTGTVDMNNLQTNITAGNNVNVTLKNVGNKNNGLVAKAGKDMNVTAEGTLSVSSLISDNNMTITADKVIAGLPYTKEQKLPDDASDRSYIEVGGTFTSNVKQDNYNITSSGDITDDGKFNQRHHIQYGDQKILLVNKRPVDNNVTDPNLPGNNNGNDKDVVEPGSGLPSTDPSVTPQDPSKPNAGDTPGDGGNNSGNGGNGGGSTGGESCEGDPAAGDNVSGENDPSLTSISDISRTLDYAVSLTSKK